MIYVMASVFIDVHQFQAKLSSFLDCNYFLIVSTASGYFRWQMWISSAKLQLELQNIFFSTLWQKQCNWPFNKLMS